MKRDREREREGEKKGNNIMSNHCTRVHVHSHKKNYYALRLSTMNEMCHENDQSYY